MRSALVAAALTTLTIAAPAAASPVLVYDNGHVTQADDPVLPPASAANPGVEAPRECRTGAPIARASAVAAAAPIAGASAIPAAAPIAQASAISVRKALRRAYA